MNSLPSYPGEAPSDRTLLLRYQASRSDAAATEIYLRYARRLVAFTRSRMGATLKSRVEAEDIVQSVFRTFFRRAERGEFAVPDGHDLWRLFLVVSLNKLRNAATHHSAAKRDAARTSGAASDAAFAVPSADADQALLVLRESVDHALEGLDVSARQMIELRLEGFEVAEIAARTGRAKRSVERVLQGFRTSMESLLNDSRPQHNFKR